MMIVKVNNFQSLEEVNLEVKGFTLIVGETSSGKSALLRSINSATSNKFRSGMVRNGEKALQVALEFDGHKFIAKKPEGGSTTLILDGSEYKKTGRDIPEEVGKVLNFATMDVGGDKVNLNIHPQFEKPLLLEYSQKKVVEILSSSTALTDLKYVQGQLSSEKSTCKGKIESYSTLLSDSKTKLAKLEETLNNKRSLKSRIESFVQKYGECNARLEKIQTLLNNISELESLKKKGTILSSIVKNCEQYLETQERSRRIIEVTTNYNTLKIKFDKGAELLQRIEQYKLLNSKVTALNLSSSLETIKKEGVLLGKKLEVLTKLKSFSDRKSEMERLLDKTSKAIKVGELVNLYSKKVAELSNIVDNNICPICGNKIGSHEH